MYNYNMTSLENEVKLMEKWMEKCAMKVWIMVLLGMRVATEDSH